MDWTEMKMEVEVASDAGGGTAGPSRLQCHETSVSENQDGIAFHYETVRPIEVMPSYSVVAKLAPEPGLGVIVRDFATLSFDVGMKCDSCGFCYDRGDHFSAVKDTVEGNEFRYYFPCPSCHTPITILQHRGMRIRTTVTGASFCKHGLQWYEQGGDMPFYPDCSSHPEVELSGRGFTRCGEHELRSIEHKTREIWDSHSRGRYLYFFQCIRCDAWVVLALDAKEGPPVPGAAPSVLCVPRFVMMDGGNMLATWLAEQINNGCLRNNTKPYRCLQCRLWDPASLLGQVKPEDLPDEMEKKCSCPRNMLYPPPHVGHPI